MYVQGSSFVYADMMDDKKYKAGFSTHKKELKENKALLQYFHGRMTDLLRSQKIAAEETPGFLESLKGIGKYNDTYNYTLYALDTGMSPAHSLDELKAQIDKTQARDIPWFQKNYLEQKNIVRYFAKKLSNRALGGDIVHAATYPHQQTYRMDAKNEQTALNYSGILNAAGTFRLQQVGHTSVFGNPPGPWSNSDEGVIPKWLFEDKFIGHLGGGKKDYIAEAQRLHMLMQDQFVSPGLRNTKFKPDKEFVDSNPFLKADQGVHTKFLGFELKEESTKKTDKFKGVIGKDVKVHRYDRKNEEIHRYNKEARLAADKKQILALGRKKGSLDPFVRVTPAVRKEKRVTKGGKGDTELAYERSLNRYLESQKKTSRKELRDTERKARRTKREKAALEKQTKRERQNQMTHGMSKKQWDLYQKDLQRKKIVQSKIPKVQPQTPKARRVVQSPSVHLSALQEYLRDQHGMNVSKKSINERALPFLAFDEKGRPALYGDPILHKTLGLSDAYRVVTGPTGYIHKSYDPEKVQPKFFSEHETGVVERY